MVFEESAGLNEMEVKQSDDVCDDDVHENGDANGDENDDENDDVFFH